MSNSIFITYEQWVANIETEINSNGDKNEVSICGTCDSSGHITCDECDGEGEVECECCGHVMECSECDGEGEVECDECDSKSIDMSRAEYNRQCKRDDEKWKEYQTKVISSSGLITSTECPK